MLHYHLLKLNIFEWSNQDKRILRVVFLNYEVKNHLYIAYFICNIRIYPHS